MVDRRRDDQPQREPDLCRCLQRRRGDGAVGSGDAFTLSGASSFGAGAVVNGGGTMSLANATIAGLTVGGTATLNDTGTVIQTGAVTIGDASASAAHLTIASGATWQLDGNVGIARGKSASSTLTVSGTLIKTAGTRDRASWR